MGDIVATLINGITILLGIVLVVIWLSDGEWIMAAVVGVVCLISLVSMILRLRRNKKKF